MKLLTLIGAGVAAGYCYKKVKNRKKNTKSNDYSRNRGTNQGTKYHCLIY
ncbi:hypothetical protein [Acinetobacter sp. ANC 4169]|nr:hypothetical protein [Acinetobacter sp. ANC 4169]